MENVFRHKSHSNGAIPCNKKPYDVIVILKLLINELKYVRLCKNKDSELQIPSSGPKQPLQQGAQ